MSAAMPVWLSLANSEEFERLLFAIVIVECANKACSFQTGIVCSNIKSNPFRVVIWTFMNPRLWMLTIFTIKWSDCVTRRNYMMILEFDAYPWILGIMCMKGNCFYLCIGGDWKHHHPNIMMLWYWFHLWCYHVSEGSSLSHRIGFLLRDLVEVEWLSSFMMSLSNRFSQRWILSWFRCWRSWRKQTAINRAQIVDEFQKLVLWFKLQFRMTDDQFDDAALNPAFAFFWLHRF